MGKLKPIARYTLPGTATVLGWLVIAANGASWGLARLRTAVQIRAGGYTNNFPLSGNARIR